MKKNVFIYHKNCDDGFGAAWSAWKKFGTRGTYVPSGPWEKPPYDLAGKNVYVMDMCYSKEDIKKLLKTTQSLTVIDHHISSKEAIALVPNHIFNSDFTHSGAVLAWNYFHPKRKIPKLLRHVEDSDVWKWKFPYSRELIASLRSHPFDFKEWSKMVREYEKSKTLNKYIEEGKAICRQREIEIKKVVADAPRVNFCGHKTLAANSAGLTDYVGEALVKKLPPIGIIWSQRKDKNVISLRSNGKVDVSKLANRFGGGGHKSAAAFRLPLNKKLPWKIIKK